MTSTIGSPLLWIGFIGFVVLMLALDLGVFHRKAHVIGFREAGIWSAVWVSLSLVFGAYVWMTHGATAGTEFLTGYVIEKSLSVDNIFVFIVIFSALGIPPLYQHRVLFWGILSALLLRAGMIFMGAAMLTRFHWLIYVFGGFLILTGIKIFWFWRLGKEEHPEESWIVRFVQRTMPSTSALHAAHFFVRENGRWLATPLFMALVLVELSDVVFALDSIPAIFAITSDPYIVFTSNIFAILGLRSMFFLLAGMMDRFYYLKVGLSAVLIFVGLKMAMADVLHVPPAISLIVIVLLLGSSIVGSLMRPRALELRPSEPPPEAAKPIPRVQQPEGSR